MASKYFIIDETIKSVAKEDMELIQSEKQQIKKNDYEQQRVRAKEKLNQGDSLKHVEGRVIVKVDLDSKDSWTFQDGTRIEYKRRFNNFKVGETNPVNAHVISGEGMTKGAEILIHPNAVHDSNKINNYKDSSDTIKYYSIHPDMCFAWHDGNDWQPLEPFAFALRVFKPYEGLIAGIEPKQLKDTLYVTTGELKGKVVKTLVACDYEIIFQNKEGREGRLIRFRPFGEEKSKREEEAIAIMDGLTKEVSRGTLLIGLTNSDAKPLNESVPVL